MKRHLILFSFALLLLCSPAFTAHASTVAYSQTSFVIGFGTFNDGFTVPVDGEYQAEIVDFADDNLFDPFDPFDTLLLAITTTSPLGLIDSVDGAGSFGTFTFAGDTDANYVANIAAVAGKSGIGLFGVEVTLVPIPQTLLLLGSGLFGLLIVRRKRGGTS
jgi:hypothetical protein